MSEFSRKKSGFVSRLLARMLLLKSRISQFREGRTMMRYVYHLLSVVILATSLTAGCVALTGKTAGRNIDDATITASVKTNLAQQRMDTLTKIGVHTNNGVVSLNGVVDSVEMKQRAAEVARQTAGVKDVENNLQIQAARG